ncbi:MAG: MATE family efflux transporter [Lachnospiraceae bacterium]|nr:MATE family efflux transporter [Lachnospiraceae bacterium]
MVLAIAVPILIQNAITNFVSLLDNIMVGQIGTEQMSGVAVANQLIFVFEICIFGIISGASIFGAQYYGSRNIRGFQNTFRFKLIYGALMLVAGLLIFWFFGDSLIGLYLHEGSDAGNLEETLRYGRLYLNIMLIGLPAHVMTQAYASTLREMGKTVLPMNAGIAAIFVNMTLNYILIFGKFGAPVMGVAGAAIATVISRFAEMLIIIILVHRREKEFEFVHGIYRTLWVPWELQKKILLKGSPLMINEALWSGGMAVLNQCYSMRGLAVIAGINISSTISNVFNVLFIALGSSVSIIVGQLLGAGKMEEAKDTDTKLIAFSVMGCVVMGGIMAVVAPAFPQIYNTTDEVRGLAARFITISALFMPLQAFMHACYFTLRSGGKTIVTLFFDSVFVWVISIPMAMALTKLTGLSIIWIYFSCQAVEIIKCIIGYVLLKKGVWLHNIVESGR